MFISCSPAEKKRALFFEFKTIIPLENHCFGDRPFLPFQVGHARANAMISLAWLKLPTGCGVGSAVNEPIFAVLNQLANLNGLKGQLINLASILRRTYPRSDYTHTHTHTHTHAHTHTHTHTHKHTHTHTNMNTHTHTPKHTNMKTHPHPHTHTHTHEHTHTHTHTHMIHTHEIHTHTHTHTQDTYTHEIHTQKTQAHTHRHTRYTH